MWYGVDPLAERRFSWSPYGYVLNNPVLRVDPYGMTDFTFDKKTGDVKQVGEVNNQTDRILKTNGKGEIKYKKNGEARVAVDGLEQGILKDGQNFMNKDNLIEVGGVNNPTVEGVEDFALKLSEFIGKEIGGSYFTMEGEKNTSHMTIGKYKYNSFKQTKGHGHVEAMKNGLTTNELKAFFHTHPSMGIRASDRVRASGADENARDNALKMKPDMKFFIITAPLQVGAKMKK